MERHADHESAVAAFFAQVEQEDPDRFREVAARYPLAEHTREFASDQLDSLAIKFPDPVNAFPDEIPAMGRDIWSSRTDTEELAMAAMNQRRPRRRASSRPRGRPRRAVPFLPLDAPVVLR